MVGVSEFSGSQNHCFLPSRVFDSLLLSEGDMIEISLKKIPAGTFLKLQPLNDDFLELEEPSALLISSLGVHYSCLTVGERIKIQLEDKEYQFNVVETKPADSGSLKNIQSLYSYSSFFFSVNLVNQTVEIDFTPPVVNKEPPSLLKEGQEREGQLQADQFQYFQFYVAKEDEQKVLKISVQALEGDPDLFISLESKWPGPYDFTWSAVLTGAKQISILPEDRKRKNACTYFVAVRAYKKDTRFKLSFNLEVNGKGKEEKVMQVPENTLKCQNCEQLVPKLFYERHKSICKKTNWKCEKCGMIIKTEEKSEHFHCERCDGIPGMKKQEMEKHIDIAHTSRQCNCGLSFELEDLLLHKQYTCELRKVKCNFCGLPIVSRNKAQHEMTCGALSDMCEFCGEHFVQSKMEDHWNSAHGYSKERVLEIRQEKEKQRDQVDPLLSSSKKELFESMTIFSCPYCDFPFDSRIKVEQHISECQAAKNMY